ncbi:hypothetical protein [Aphanothece minutissima]|uniref:hypothetical protein n=1 Tax=Aphanothece minutissima TaxID=543815 RepID=UPI0011B1CEA5|nr:hypothetical protein [Aphanothece minutissima]
MSFEDSSIREGCFDPHAYLLGENSEEEWDDHDLLMDGHYAREKEKERERQQATKVKVIVVNMNASAALLGVLRAG